MVVVSEDDFMGKGIAKVVYKHPDNENVCIKFPNKEKKRSLIDLKREISYLKKHQEHIPWLAPYLGEVNCNIGLGYMYEIVRNEDGTMSTPIAKKDAKKHASIIKKKVSSMYSTLIERHAVVNDLSLSNVFFQRNKDSFELILIDGFGNNNFIKIADYSKYFLIKKLNKKFKRLCTRLEIPFDFVIEYNTLVTLPRRED